MRAVQFFRWHFVHRKRRTTSSNLASHPANAASVLGLQRRMWPQEHLRKIRYWPNSSDSFSILRSRMVDTVHKHSIKARQTLQGFRPGRRDAASSPLLRCAGSGAWRARQPEGNKIVGKIVLSILAVMGLALTSAAALPASATLRVIAVQTNDIKTYRHEVDTLQSEFKKEGLPVTLRVWRATYAGPDTGTIIVTVEVPDLATLAKIGEAVAKPNSALGATMKRIDALRKIASDSLYEEISP